MNAIEILSEVTCWQVGIVSFTLMAPVSVILVVANKYRRLKEVKDRMHIFS